MTEENESSTVGQEQTLDIEDVKRRIDMLDQRLDNIDSIVSAVAERVMKQPIALNITCPHCGKNIEITSEQEKRPRG